MSVFKRIFGEHIQFDRESSDPVHASAGLERQKYLEAAAIVLGRPSAEIDPVKTLQGDYGCDDFDVSECVQVAEEVWRVRLMPNPMTARDIADAMVKFTSLNAIMAAAEAAQSRG